MMNGAALERVVLVALPFAALLVGGHLMREVLFALREGYFRRAFLLGPVISGNSRQHEPFMYWAGIIWIGGMSLAALAGGLLVVTLAILALVDPSLVRIGH